jgi:hypothetical protein
VGPHFLAISPAITVVTPPEMKRTMNSFHVVSLRAAGSILIVITTCYCKKMRDNPKAVRNHSGIEDSVARIADILNLRMS